MKQLIFAVEDDEAIRDLYTLTLEGAGFGVECFEDSSALFARLTEVIPDLMLLDIMLDGMNGYEILQKIKSENKLKDIPVIMVSAKDEEISKVKGLNLGADDYISKPFGVLELIARINANVRKSASAKKRTLYKDIIVDDSTHKVIVAGKERACALKEYKLLRILVENAETVVKRDELLDKVWNTEFFGETRTVDMHIKSLRKLLSESGSSAEIVTIRGVGFVLKQI